MRPTARGKRDSTVAKPSITRWCGRIGCRQIPISPRDPVPDRAGSVKVASMWTGADNVHFHSLAGIDGAQDSGIMTLGNSIHKIDWMLAEQSN